MSRARLALALLLLGACAGPRGLAGSGGAPSTATRRALDGWLGGQPEAAHSQFEALAAGYL